MYTNVYNYYHVIAFILLQSMISFRFAPICKLFLQIIIKFLLKKYFLKA